jgi:hypothetical protein
MGKVTAHLHHFSTGEYSTAALARVDMESTRLAAEISENILPHAIGKGLCRPGLGYLANTRGNQQARLLPFVRDTDDVAILELCNVTLRVMVDDAFITRPSVTSTVTNGDFSSSAGWTLSTTDGANAAISGGVLTMDADARGSEAYCERSVTTSSAGTEHALEIVVTRGPVVFRCGSASGTSDYIEETTLDTGRHSLAFTPSGTYYVRFITRTQRDCIVDSIQVASAGVMQITAPWSTDDLRNIRFDQSADVVFLANRNWRPRKIERRGTRSWSLVEYHSDDGPFVAGNNRIQVTASATHGNVTLTSNASYFNPDMVGSLVRLYHDRFDATYDLAGDGVYTDVFTVRGIRAAQFDDRTFNYTTTGTWTGTVRVQRSLTGPDGDFLDYQYDDSTSATTFTTNQTIVHLGETDDNNITSYTRIGFIDGAYTSGVMTVAVSYEGFSGYGVGRITGYTNSLSVDVEVLEDFNADTGTRSWEIGAWSTDREWPSAVVLFDGRLWWGGEDDVWASGSDQYYTFDDLEEGDSATIQRAVATGGQVSRVNWFLPLGYLIIGTTGAEVSVKASTQNEPLTPDNISLKDCSTYGSTAVSPVKIDSRGIYVHRSLKNVFALKYSFEANDYTSEDLTAFNEDICGDGIVEMAVQRNPESYVWCVRSDGEVALLIYDWAEEKQLLGWHRFITDGVVESVCVVPGASQDAVYMAVQRTINGSTVRFVEKLALHTEAIGGATHKMADAGQLFAGPVSSVTMAHLANETSLVGWGTKDGVAQPITGLSANASGVISLGGTYTNVWVGLGYDCRYKSSKLAYGAEGGTALLQKKRVSQFGVLLANTHRDAVRFGPNFTDLRQMDLVRGGTAVTANTVYDVYDDATFPFPGDWNTDSRLCLKVSAPYPATLLGLVVGVETNEK